MSDKQARARVGQLIASKYRLERLLGAGGMGAVYAATHEFTKRKVAVKLMHEGFAASSSFAERFIREAQAPSAIGHPGIVEVLDGGFDEGGALYLVLEMLQGETLGDIEPPLDVPELVDAVVQLLEALGAAHKAGFVHRDIKPDNVFVTRDSAGRRKVKLLDFGVAGLRESAENNQLTQTGTILGTPTFMSPEQAKGERVDQRSDLWAVGAILYEALAGRAPYEAETYNAVIVSIVTREHVPLERVRPDLPRALLEVIERGLRKDTSVRWQSAEQMAKALRAIPDLAALSGVVTRPVTPVIETDARAATAVARVKSGGAKSVDAPPLARPGGFTEEEAGDGPDAGEAVASPKATVARRAAREVSTVDAPRPDKTMAKPQPRNLATFDTPMPASRAPQEPVDAPAASPAAASTEIDAPFVPARASRPATPSVAGRPSRSATTVGESNTSSVAAPPVGLWVGGAAAVIVLAVGGALLAKNARATRLEVAALSTAPTSIPSGPAPYAPAAAVPAPVPTAPAEPTAAPEPSPPAVEPPTAAAPLPTTPAPEPPAKPLNSEDLSLTLSAAQAKLQRCYQDLLAASLLAGTATPPAVSLNVTLKVAESGSVRDVILEGAAPDTLTRCVRGHLEGFSFRATSQPAELSFPVVFQPAVIAP